MSLAKGVRARAVCHHDAPCWPHAVMRRVGFVFHAY